jgi:hypothetical protein
MYAVGMARERRRTVGLSFRTTPYVKALLQAIMNKGGYASEAATMDAIIREEAKRLKVKTSVSEEAE